MFGSYKIVPVVIYKKTQQGGILMKTKEELNAIKEEIKQLNEKLSTLTSEELEQVIGGGSLQPIPMLSKQANNSRDESKPYIEY